MKIHFSILKINQASIILEELVGELYRQLQGKGFECSYSINKTDKKKFNILVGQSLVSTNLQQWADVNLFTLPGYACVNFEPLNVRLPFIPPYIYDTYLNILSRSNLNLDYSPLNVEFLLSKGIEARVIKLPISVAVHNESNTCKGGGLIALWNSTRRRQDLLEKLKSSGLDVAQPKEIYGEERLKQLGKFHIGLHAHSFDGSNHIPVPRIKNYLEAGVLPVVESSAYDLFGGKLINCEYEGLGWAIQYALGLDSVERESRIKAAIQAYHSSRSSIAIGEALLVYFKESALDS